METTSHRHQPRVAILALAVFLGGCGASGGSTRQSCEAGDCHGAAGTERGIEVAHPGFSLVCTDCHGGDGTAADKDTAHVAPWPQFVADRGGYLRNLSVQELDDVDPAYMRFQNPGDYRVAEKSCGAISDANDGSGCHQGLVDSAPRSTMATFVGHFNAARFQAGLQGRAAVFGSRDIDDPDFPDPAPLGAVRSLVQAVIPAQDAPRDSVATAMDHYLPKNCTHCHQWSYGRNDARGNYRSSGCTSCHMLYSDDGISLSADPSAAREVPPHPERHQLTLAIPETQCEHCHFQGARIGLLYRGVIEHGFATAPLFPDIGEALHNHPPDFYLQASVNPAHPADLHYLAGMACVDCHVGRDVHGDGRIYSNAKLQVAVRCENCHGTVNAEIAEGQGRAPLLGTGEAPDCEGVTGDPAYFLNCNGDPLRHVYRGDDGTIWLRPAKGGPELRIAQIARVLASGVNPNMVQAMGRDPVAGRSHTEVLECHACHTAYRQYCFGCHVTLDYSQEKTDLLTGARTAGVEIAERQDYSLDLYFIGTNHRGKVASFCPSMQVFVSAVDRDENGDYFSYFEDRIRRAASGKVGFNWAVDAPHVVSRKPQNCSRCHADQGSACDDTRARETYGFGTGRYTFTDEDGTTHDLTQLLDPSGEPLVDFSHEGQGPVAAASRARALAACVADHPR